MKNTLDWDSGDCELRVGADGSIIQKKQKVVNVVNDVVPQEMATGDVFSDRVTNEDPKKRRRPSQHSSQNKYLMWLVI